MESTAALSQETQSTPKPATTGHKCQGVCCACRPIRVMRDNCLKNNSESDCLSFVDAFKQCVDSKRQEIAARKALEEQQKQIIPTPVQ
eukprot:403375835